MNRRTSASQEKTRKKQAPSNSRKIKQLIDEYDDKLKLLQISRSISSIKKHKKFESLKESTRGISPVKPKSYLAQPTKGAALEKNFSDKSLWSYGLFQTRSMNRSAASATPATAAHENLELQLEEKNKEIRELVSLLHEQEKIYTSKIFELEQQISHMRNSSINSKSLTNYSISSLEYEAEKLIFKEEFQSKLEVSLFQQKEKLKQRYRAKIEEIKTKLHNEFEKETEITRSKLLYEFELEKQNSIDDLKKSYEKELIDQENQLQTQTNTLLESQKAEHETKTTELTNSLYHYKTTLENLENSHYPLCSKCKKALSIQENLSQKLKSISKFIK